MKKILIPTDFSVSAANAIDFAVQSAKLFTCEIVLLHVVDQSVNLQAHCMGFRKDSREAGLRGAYTKLIKLKAVVQEIDKITVNICLYGGSVTG